jgi:hypothetical protein
VREEFEPMTGLLGWLITILDVISLEAFVPDAPRERRGLARTFVSVLGISNTSVLIDRLGADKSLRRARGWERRAQIPSEATFSRAFTKCAQGDLPKKMHAALVERALGGRITGTIAREATEIEARERRLSKTRIVQYVKLRGVRLGERKFREFFQWVRSSPMLRPRATKPHPA